ncbi:MAG: hypothetical protein D6820_17365 [Lentisphaerae bacterium]|nr:MAG: hypothetical protein D6820_17365 [Lentisphaerota bacterium]
MCEIVYPEPFSARVLRNETPGGEPVRLEVSLPSVGVAGQPVSVHLVLLDEKGYPCHTDGSMQEVVVTDGEKRVRARLAPHGIASLQLKDWPLPQIDNAKFYRLHAECGTIFGTSNAMRLYEDPRDDGLSIFFGDPHVHTVLSRCHDIRCRSLNFAYTAARHVAALDWMAATDHVSNGRCDSAKWKEEMLACELYCQSPEFTTIPAYEASLQGACGGDVNVYLNRCIGQYVDHYEEGNIRTLVSELRELVGSDAFFVVPHHTTRTGKHGEIPRSIFPGSAWLPAVEIYSQWGTSEYRGNPDPLTKIHPGPSYVQDLLNQGYRLGFLGGTDTHATMPFGYGDNHLPHRPGGTGVWAEKNDRYTIWHQLYSRHTYAVRAEKIFLEAYLAQKPMGSAFDISLIDEELPLEVTVGAKSRVNVELVTSGKSLPLATLTPEEQGTIRTHLAAKTLPKLECPDVAPFSWAYIRVRTDDGNAAWSSPFWFGSWYEPATE